MPVEGYKAAVVVIETESHEKAVKDAEAMKKCPYLIGFGVNYNTTTAFYMAPEEKAWWLNYSEMFPKSKSKTYMIQDIYYPLHPREIKASKNPPCGAVCSKCPEKENHDCKGCVAVQPK